MIFAKTINNNDISHCPKCNTNHNGWHIRDGDDLVCLPCGWRDFFHFNHKKWLDMALIECLSNLGICEPNPEDIEDKEVGISCKNCGSKRVWKWGKCNGRQRYMCQDCNYRFIENANYNITNRVRILA